LTIGGECPPRRSGPDRRQTMPSYKDLLKLIGQGLSPDEIIDRLGVTPYRLQQLMSNKYLAEHLKLQEELARTVVRHQTATGILPVAQRLREIAFGEGSETARKACVMLLGDALNAEDQPPPAAEDVDPLSVLRPLGPINGPEDDDGAGS